MVRALCCIDMEPKFRRRFGRREPMDPLANVYRGNGGCVCPSISLFFRTDRDNYLRVDMNNVQPGEEVQYDKEKEGSYGTPYDYLSIMHYGPDFFGKIINVSINELGSLALVSL